MYKKVISAFAIALILIFTACERNFLVGSNDDSGDREPVARDATSLEKTLASADNTFGFKLLNQLNTETGDSNLFISPFSVSMALGMTLNGAAGETERAMRETLELTGLSQEEINETYQTLMELLPYQDAKVLFEIANSIWVKQGYPVLPFFLEVNQTYFDAETREMDFTRPEALDIINGWISDKTHGKIENALDRIPPSIVMYLINAIYFKAAWTYEFDPEDTYTTPFHTPYGDRDCRMMQQEGKFLYFATDDFQAIDLPYGNGKFSMTVFLPAPGTSADDLIAQMTDANWQLWKTRFDSASLVLGLPKFKVEYGTLLNDALTALGMGIAFSSSANFSGINPDGDLLISRVIHKTFVEVNEEGTEAAAVTIVEMIESSIGQFMIMNRPFVFVIHDHNTGAILFMGKIVEPTPGE
ncbi:serpin family protein [bacterium]|nr:serpin family protein [bacterium]